MFLKSLIHLRVSTVKTEVRTPQEHVLAGRLTDPKVVIVMIRRHQASSLKLIFSSNGWYRTFTDSIVDDKTEMSWDERRFMQNAEETVELRNEHYQISLPLKNR